MSEGDEDEFEDSKGLIRQHNGQKKKDKRANSNLQNITEKTKD